MNVTDIAQRVAQFEAAAHKILGYSESAPSRIILIKETYDKLEPLSLKQEDMLRQALRCVEVNVFRGAHVLAWAALTDYLQENTAADGFKAINAVNPKWNVKTIEELREGYAEYNIIVAMRTAGQLTKSEMKAFHGLLTRRNDCAHPSDYYPGLNETLGYVSEIIKRIGAHQKRAQSQLKK